jgi:hypothetical protein
MKIIYAGSQSGLHLNLTYVREYLLTRSARVRVLCIVVEYEGHSMKQESFKALEGSETSCANYQFAAGLVTCELSFCFKDSPCINVPLDLMTRRGGGGLHRTGERGP